MTYDLLKHAAPNNLGSQPAAVQEFQDHMSYYSCATCNRTVALKHRRPLQACLMALLASLSKAFIPTSMRVSSFMSTSSSTTTPRRIHGTRQRTRRSHEGGSRPLLHVVPSKFADSRRSRDFELPRILAATPNDSGTGKEAAPGVAFDDVKSDTMATIEAAERALTEAGASQATEDDEVQATVAAARAAARAAMNSLRRDADGSGFAGGGGGLEDEIQSAFAARQAVISPARAAVDAALSAVAEKSGEETASIPSPSAAEARKAIEIVQAALGRRDEAAASLEGPISDMPNVNSNAAKDGKATADSTGDEVAIEERAAVEKGTGEAAGVGEGDDFDEEPTKEPESALQTRNSPAASHGLLAHLLWRQVAGPGDTVIDCTAGNGHDSLELAKIVALEDGVGRLYCIDIQEQALQATRTKLQSELGDRAIKRAIFKRGNFRDLPEGVAPMSVQLIVYNLGWLPGGDKTITTKLEDTLKSIDIAKRLVQSGGMISVMCYQGHAEGARETKAVLEYVKSLTHYHWRVFVHERTNRPGSPLLVTLYRL